MAGGRGSRLKGYQNSTPKPLVRLSNNKSMIHNLINVWKSKNFSYKDITISVHHESKRIIDHVQKNISSDINFIIEDKLYGTAGTINNNYESFTNTFVTNCDVLPKDGNLNLTINEIDENIIFTEDLIYNCPFGLVNKNNLNYLLSVSEKPKFVFEKITGIYFFKKPILYEKKYIYVDMPEYLEFIKDSQRFKIKKISNLGTYDLGTVLNINKFNKEFYNYK